MTILLLFPTPHPTLNPSILPPFHTRLLKYQKSEVDRLYTDTVLNMSATDSGSAF